MFHSLIEKRRSIRKFTDRAVEAEKVQSLIEAALRSPSSMHSQPWEFVVVQNRQTMQQLSLAKPHGSGFLKDATLGIVVCADPQRSSVWVEDAAIASIFIHLAAASIGLGSCWVQVRDRMHSDTQTAQEYVAAVLKIPEDRRILSIIGIGYPAERKAPHPKESLLNDRVYAETHGRAFFGSDKRKEG
jgi:nitroreductase